MKNTFALRIFLDIVIFVSAIMGYWWLSFLIGLLAAWYFKKYFEFPLALFVFDMIYAAPRERVDNFQFVYFTFAVLFFAIITFLKSKVRKNPWQKGF